MTIRLGTLATNNTLVNLLLRTQQRIVEGQVQVTSEKVSQTYAGIGTEAQRLVNLETTSAALERFTRNNDAMQLRLDTTATVLDGAKEVIRDFRNALDTFNSSGVKTEAAVQDIQEWAFRSLQSMQALLNTQADGRYVLSGARVQTPPVDLNLTSLSQFQADYDGAGTAYPTTRDAHLEKFSISDDGAGNANWLYFERTNGGSGLSRVTSTTAQFANVSVGTRIEISGTASNDGFYTVSAVNGGGTSVDLVTEQFTDEGPVAVTVTYPDPNDPYTILTVTDTVTFNRAAGTMTGTGALDDIPAGSAFTVAGSTNNNGTYTVDTAGDPLTIVMKRLTDEGAAAAEVDGTISADNYYNGDEVDLTHRVDTDRSITLDLNAVDPAFEKAIRAMSIIAQGVYGTEGGLDQNAQRVNQARYLLGSALDRTVIGTPPFGTELTSNIETLEQRVGFNQVLVDATNESHRKFIGFLDESVADIENVNPTEAITRLLDDTRALEASYQALARIRELSLSNYLT